MKKLILICQNISYLKQLTDVLPKYLSREWTVSGFERKEESPEVKGTAAVVLAEVPAEDRVVFARRWEGSTLLWLTNMKTGAENEVFMYGTVSSIAEKVCEACDGSGKRSLREPDGQELRVHGYAASEGGCGCTTEAYRKAVLMAASGKTAFLCMDRTPGIAELPDQDGGVSELVYLLQEYGKSWTEHMKYCAKSTGALTVFAGVRRTDDTALFRESESEAFLAGLREKEYRNLIIDFGTGGTEDLMTRCDVIWSCGGRNKEKLKALERQAESGGFRDRLRPVKESSEEKTDGIAT